MLDNEQLNNLVSEIYHEPMSSAIVYIYIYIYIYAFTFLWKLKNLFNYVILQIINTIFKPLILLHQKGYTKYKNILFK